jgi:electron transport complex protein RnfC
MRASGKSMMNHKGFLALAGLSKTFRGGVALSESKELTVDKKIKPAPAPPEVIIPLGQHIGTPNRPLVKTGDRVKVGQCIGRAEAHVSCPVHASVAGTVKTIGDFPNPVYGKRPAVVITNDMTDESVSFAVHEEIDGLSREELIAIVKDAGIAGLGGAAFPTHVKLNVPKDKGIHTLVVNGAECEPYLTGDHRLMIEKTQEVQKGIDVVARITGVNKIILAIEENKLSAVFAMQKETAQKKRAYRADIQVVILKTKYPQGGEKQLIKAIFGKEVPPGKLPLDVGLVVQNVGTCYAVCRAVYAGEPLYERCVTFTGTCLKEPGNYAVRIGTTLRHVVESCGGFTGECAKVIAGGPMMGITQYSLDVPVMKGVTGVLFLSRRDAALFEESACIRCGRCVDVCPVRLLPTEIMRMVKYERWHYTDELYPSDCMECGACTYACPARIPLVQYVKLAKRKALERK